MSEMSTVEKQARCPHNHTSKEVICGMKTGDKVCNDCGEAFWPGEEIRPVEYRTGMVLTPHALLIALHCGKVELKKNIKSLASETYKWALVDKSTGEIIVPVATVVVDDCISKGYLKL